MWIFIKPLGTHLFYMHIKSIIQVLFVCEPRVWVNRFWVARNENSKCSWSVSLGCWATFFRSSCLLSRWWANHIIPVWELIPGGRTFEVTFFLLEPSKQSNVIHGRLSCGSWHTLLLFDPADQFSLQVYICQVYGTVLLVHCGGNDIHDVNLYHYMNIVEWST